MHRDLYLAIDIGTGSVRAALVDSGGSILAIAVREHDQIVPQYGWSEQRPADWWDGVVRSVRGVLDQVERSGERVAAICACGQMHGTVMLDADGRPTMEAVPLWSDKRTAGHVAAFEGQHDPGDFLALTANPPTPAWPAFKLQWIRDLRPDAYRATRAMVMPKDYVNYRLTGELAMDRTEASCSFLMDPATGDWSPVMIERLGLEDSMLMPIRAPTDVLGHLTSEAAALTGLAKGIPVMVGGGDYPVALLGSGASRPGDVSEVSGTSSIVTLISQKPILDPEICNVATVEGNWGAFVLLESGGDAMRWARRAFHEGTVSYEEIVRKAEQAPAGSEGLFFLPYLSGERFGEHRNSRAQFFGIAAGHGITHLHRAVLEGVAFAVKRHIRIMAKATSRVRPDRVIASGGGAKAELWTHIKASAYGLPILVPREPECGVVGCAIIAAAGTGRFASLQEGVLAFVGYDREIEPDKKWARVYERMQPVFERLYAHSQSFYDDLDALSADDQD